MKALGRLVLAHNVAYGVVAASATSLCVRSGAVVVGARVKGFVVGMCCSFAE